MENYVVCAHDCVRSSNYHHSKYRHWMKLVEKVDTTKSDGYAFGGSFLSCNAEHSVKEGSVIVECCGDDVVAYRITKEGKVKIAAAKRRFMTGLIKAVAEAIAESRSPENRREELLRRKEELLKELEKIEKELEAYEKS